MTEAPETSDISFSRRDIDGLTDALSKIAGQLTRRQWSLLVSIFAAAAGNLEIDDDDTSKGTFSGVKIDGNPITGPRQKDVKELRDQLRKAHMPAKPPGKPLGFMVTPPKPHG
jgi:hypothetical protein